MDKDGLVFAVSLVLVAFAVIGGCTAVVTNENNNSAAQMQTCIDAGGQYIRYDCVRSK